jgi:tRNA threonylcarbamoyladenosine biosynthesis protein TsaE
MAPPQFGGGAFCLLCDILYSMKKELGIEDLKKFVEEFLGELISSEEKATVVGLEGNLGAGKTTFTKEVAKQLGIEEEITSPTFNLMRSYKTNNDKFKKLVHIDLYRIESEDEVNILDFENLFKEPNTLVLIEWVDKVNLENINLLKISYINENKREVEIIYA